MNDDCTLTGDKDYSDVITGRYVAGMSRMANNLLHGTLSLDDWHSGMKDAIKSMYGFQALAGVGGDASQISDKDLARIEAQVKEQYSYLDGFAAKIVGAVDENGASLEFISNQSQMYAKVSQVSYWRQAIGDADLPTVPGEDCEGLGNCACSWVCKDGQWYWELGEADHCDTCVKHAKEWSPYVPDDQDLEEAA